MIGMHTSAYINTYDWVVGNIISDNREVVQCVNGASGTRETFTITVGTGTANVNYTGYLNEVPFSYPNGNVTNTTTIATGLRDFLRRHPSFKDVWSFESSAAVVTAVYKRIGKEVSASTSDAKLTVANTVNAATPAALRFGEPVFAVNGGTDSAGGDALFVQPLNSTNFALQQFELTLDYVSGAVVIFTGSIDGYGPVGIANAMATDLATTRTAIIADLQAELPSAFFTVAAHATASKITITATNYGVNGQFSCFGGVAGAKATIAKVNPTAATNASKLFVGIVPRNEAAFASDTEMGYAYNRAFAALQKGKIIVAFSGAAAKYGDDVYYNYATKTFVTALTAGEPAPASSVTYISGLYFEAVNAAGTMAAIRVRD